MADCYACKSEFGLVFARVVTLSRFEILGAIGELETTNLLTGNGVTGKNWKSPGQLFSPLGHRELGRDSRDTVTNAYLPRFFYTGGRDRRDNP